MFQALISTASNHVLLTPNTSQKTAFFSLAFLICLMILFLQTFWTFRILNLILKRGLAKFYIEKHILVFLYILFISLFNVLNTREFLVIWRIAPFRKEIFKTSFPIPSPLHPVVIILIVISINHLEIKVRKETICYYIRTA